LGYFLVILKSNYLRFKGSAERIHEFIRKDEDDIKGYQAKDGNHNSPNELCKKHTQNTTFRRK